MKLHLPKKLFAAVMACMATFSGITTTVGTGVIAGGVATYMFAGAQAQAGWGADARTNGYIYWYSDSTTDLVAPTADNGVAVANPDYATKGDKYTNLFICSEASNNSVTLTKLSAGNGVSFTMAANPWNSNNFSNLAIDVLAFDGKGSFNNSHATSAATIKTVSGTLSSVSNSGTLTLGEAGKTINISGTITNTGTMTLLGTINVTDLSGLEGHFVGYTDGNNGFEIYDGYTVIDGDVDLSAAKITVKGAEVELVDGRRIATEQMVGDTYYLNTGSSTYEAQNGDSFKLSSAGGTLIVSAEAGSTIKMEGLTLTAATETVLSTTEGVTLSGSGDRLVINAVGQNLVVGSGVHLNYTGLGDVETSPVPAERYALSIGNGTLTIAGGTVSTFSLVMQDGGSTTSTLNITDGGLLEITGTTDSDYKKGCVRLGHWGGTGSVLNVSDGEFRSEKATISMGDDGQGNLVIESDGVANLKGIVRLNTASQLQVKNGGKLNVGIGGISGGGAINVDGATLGALSAEGWTSATTTKIGNGSTIQLAVYNVNTGEYGGSADITLSGTHTGTGSLVLAGSGQLTISSAMLNDISLAEGSTATLAVNGLEQFVLESATGYTGYGDSTTDGYAAGESYRVAGEGSTLDSVTLIQDGVESVHSMVDGALIIQDDNNANFYVNTEVNRSDIATLREGTVFNVAAGGVFRTHLVEDMANTKALDSSATIYLQNAEGTDVLKLTNLPAEQTTGFAIDGNTVVADAGTYSADITVLSGVSLSQAQTDGNDKVGLNYLQNTERTITVQDGASFDIAGKEAYYHVVLEEGAVLSNTGAAVGKTNRNLPVVDLTGNATIDATNRFGMLGSGYDTVHLNLNGNTLTKTGAGIVHFTNCVFDEGTICIENGYVELVTNSNKDADYSSATFELCADAEAGTYGGLDYMGRSTDVIGHIVGNGGTLLVGTGYTANVDKLSGSHLAKNGLGAMVMGAGASIEGDINIAATAGSLTLKGGVTVNGNAAIAANRGALTLGALSVAEGKTLTVSGGALADSMSNTGAGMLKIDSLSGMVSYASAADKMQIESLTGATIIDLFGIADQLAGGVDLGIAYSEDNLKNLQIAALDDSTYELVDNGGYIKLQAKGDATLSLSTDWDINWGARGLLNEPATLTDAVITDFNSDGKGLSEVGYLVDGQVAVKLVANGVTDVAGGPDTPKAVCGAAYDAPGTAGTVITIEKGVWIEAVSGKYGAIVGGSMAGNWGSATPSVVTTDSHIVIDYEDGAEDLFIRNVIGGNMGDCANKSTASAAQFNGNSYVSIHTSDVGIAVVGGSATFHGGCSIFNGDTNVFVYTPLTNGGSAMRGEVSAVIGGMMGADSDNNDSASNNALNGNSNVLVDLTSSTSTTDFAKLIIGGNACVRGTSTVNGTSTLTINGTNASGQAIKFAGSIAGGSYTKGGTVNHGSSVLNINGGTYASYVSAGNYIDAEDATVTQTDSTLNINGGTFNNYLSGGALLMKKGTANVTGTSTVSITDASVTGWLSGGSFTNSSNSTVKQGAVVMSINNTSFTKETAGGSFVGGTGTNNTIGDVTITVNGASFGGNLYGGAYHFSNAGASTSTVGDVTITLAGGTISGSIYAAGGTRATSGNMTVASTTIEVDGAATIAANSVVSAGFGVPAGSSPNFKVTGDRSIIFTGDADQDRTGVLFADFNQMGVETAGVTATIGGGAMTLNDAFTIVGKGTLKLATGTALTVNGGATIDGTVDLNGQSVVGDVTVGEGNLIVNGGTINGNITLAAGSTLTLWDGADAATNDVLNMAAAGDVAVVGTGNTLTIDGLFNVNVGLDLNAMTEVDLITGFDVDSLSISGIELDSENKVQAAGMVLNGTEVTADQNLWLVLDGDTLKLSTMAGLEDFYWEGGDGNWSDAGWAMEDGGTTLVDIKDAATREDAVNAIFSGSSATITVDTVATVDDMSVTITGGDYTFVPANDGASLSINGTLKIDGGAHADIQMDASAGSVVVTDEGSSLAVDTLTVGEGGLTMDKGSLKAEQLTGEGAVAITGGQVELTNGSDVAGGTSITGAEFVGNSTLSDVTVGNVSVDASGSLDLADSTLVGQLAMEDGATLELSGNIHLDTSASDFGLDNQSTFASTSDASDLGSVDGDGFITMKEIYTVVTGDTDNLDSDATWTVGAENKVGTYGVDGEGVVTVAQEKELTTYWVNNEVTLSDVSGSFTDATTAVKLNGGTFNVDADNSLQISTNNENAKGDDSVVVLSNGVELSASNLVIADGTTVTLEGDAGTVYDLGTSSSIEAGKLLGLDDTTGWKGTVTSADAAVTDISALGNSSSVVELTADVDTSSLALGTVGTVKVASLTADSVSAVAGDSLLTVTGKTLLKSGNSTLNNADFKGGLELGTESSAASLTAAELSAAGITLVKGNMTVDSLIATGTTTMGENASIIVAEDATMNGLVANSGSSLTVGGELNLGKSTLELKDLTSTITTKSLAGNSIDFSVDTDLLRKAADAGQSVTLLTVTDGSDAAISLNGGGSVISVAGEKYAYQLNWTAADAGTAVTMTAVANGSYVREKFAGSETNVMAGAALMDSAFAGFDPQNTAPGSDLAKLMDTVDNKTMKRETLAAVAGSSTATLGMAFAGDVERQLRAIRNRTTTMGVNQTIVNEGLPYVNAWVNAEGNHAEMDADGTAAGYSMDSWGGTIGFDVDVTTNLTVGVALTAMYGDITADGPDMAEGSLDTLYFSAFARYAERATTHTFVATIGHMTGDLERTVNYGTGSYTSKGDTDGLALGLMYEYGKVYKLNESGDACWQPILNVAWRSVLVNGYDESGSDVSLKVDDQAMHTFTIGAGARMQAIVGENLYNRTSILELRALAKVDIGDTKSEVDVALLKGGKSAGIESAELGMFGVELGAGLSVPVGDDDGGSLFFDVSAEIRDGYTNFNGTVGYRINF